MDFFTEIGIELFTEMGTDWRLKYKIILDVSERAMRPTDGRAKYDGKGYILRQMHVRY